jgi:hypothetical protein
MKVTAKDVAELSGQAAVWWVNDKLQYRSTFLACDVDTALVKVTGEKKTYSQAGYSNEEIAEIWQETIDNWRQ